AAGADVRRRRRAARLGRRAVEPRSPFDGARSQREDSRPLAIGDGIRTGGAEPASLPPAGGHSGALRRTRDRHRDAAQDLPEEGGSEGVVIEVPPPAATTIVLRDARTRDPLDVGTLELSPDRTPDINQWRSLRFEFDPGAKGYVVRAAAGSYDLDATGFRYRV